MGRKEWMNPDKLNLETKADLIMHLSHLSAYEQTINFVKNKKALEIGCGAGYGSRFLADFAESITTFDIDSNSLEYAKKNNFSDKVTYVLGDATKGLPFNDNFFDIVISFQVIEHIKKKDLKKYFTEIKRVTKTNGKVIFTTPNRLLRLQKFQKPLNPFHQVEYSPKTLKLLLNKFFKQPEILGLHAIDDIIEFKLARKQTKFSAYFRNPIRRLVLNSAKRIGLKRLVTKMESKSEKSRLSKGPKAEGLKYTINDFWFSEDKIKRSIDLTAVCSITK